MSQSFYTYGDKGIPIVTPSPSHHMVYIPVSHAPPTVAARPTHNAVSTTTNGITAIPPSFAPTTASVTTNDALRTSSAAPGQPTLLVPISAFPASAGTSTRTYDIVFVSKPGKKTTYHRELQVRGHPVYTIERDKPHFKARQLNFLDSQTREYLAGVRLAHWRQQVSITLGDPYSNAGYVALFEEPKFHYNGREFEWQRNTSTQTRLLVENVDDERVLAKWKVDEGIGTVEWMVTPEREFEIWCLAAVFAFTEARRRYKGGNGAGGCGGGCSSGAVISGGPG